jgi:hypothetical protein
MHACSFGSRDEACGLHPLCMGLQPCPPWQPLRAIGPFAPSMPGPVIWAGLFLLTMDLAIRPNNARPRYGKDYLLRAAVALFGLGANAPEAAVYMTGSKDSKGAPITGAKGNVYTVTFAAPPPASGFASVTAYNSSNKFFPAPSSSSVSPQTSIIYPGALRAVVPHARLPPSVRHSRRLCAHALA